MSKLRIGLRTGAALALAVLVMIPVSYELVQKRMFEQGTDGTKPAFTLPLGAQTYSIAQAAEVWPKIREARIDPPDVHVGDVQTIEVVVQSHGAIQEVYADVETDTDTVRVPLSYVEDVAGDLRDPIAELTGQGVAQKASADDTVQRRYRGQWTVRDTHDTTYHTTIVAKGDEGTSSVVMAWSDVCSIPPGGDFTLGGPCTISADDGIDDGNFTVSGSMTINANFAVNSGKQIIISGGSIALCEGCTITQTNIWQVDSDGDGFPADSVMTLADDVGFGIGGLRRRYLLEAEQDYDDNTYDPTNSGGAAAAVRVAYYPFDDDTGSSVYDYSGYGNDGTITDGYTSWVTGYNDTLGFRMNSWLLEIPSTASLETLNGDMSVNFMWYNGQSGEDQDLRRPFLRKGDESDAMDFNIRIESGLRIGGYGGDQTGWGFDGESRVNGTWPHWLSPNSQTFQYRDWHMVTLVREGGEGRAYEDGQLIYSFSGDDPGYMDPTSYPMYLGLTDVSKDNDVIVDELAIYSGVLTNSEIEDLWATLSGGIGGGLGDGGCLLCGGGGGEAL